MSVYINSTAKLWAPAGLSILAQRRKKIIFCGTLTAGSLKTEITDGKLNILQEGRVKKIRQRTAGNYVQWKNCA